MTDVAILINNYNHAEQTDALADYFRRRVAGATEQSDMPQTLPLQKL